MYLCHLSKAFFYQIHTLITDLCLLLLNLKIYITTIRTDSRNLRQYLILTKEDSFLKKGTSFKKKGPQNFTTPYSVPFLSVFYQNNVLHNFHRRGQHSIVKPPKGLINSWGFIWKYKRCAGNF